MNQLSTTQIRQPAEWEAQSGILLTWPHRHSAWKDSLPQIEQVYLKIALAIAEHETLLIAAFDEAHKSELKIRLKNAGIDMALVRIDVAPSNDSWARDHGPISILCNSQPTLIDFTFNGWGNKYSAELDNQVTKKLYQANAFAQVPLIQDSFVLEGGSIECNGQNTILTTEACLLAKSRNPRFNRTEIEQALTARLGAAHFLWLSHGHLAGDDTDSHIDMLARFVAPDTIAYTCCENPDDEHFQELKKMEAELRAFEQSNGEAYNLVALPLPSAIHNADGLRLPASYANFLIINNAVLLPIYDVPEDRQAEHCLRNLFPDRRIVGIDCRALIEEYGSVHCCTMQLPSGILDQQQSLKSLPRQGV